MSSGYQRLYQVPEKKTLLTPLHSLKSFSEPRPSGTLEIMKTSKLWVSILLVTVDEKWSFPYTIKQGNRADDEQGKWGRRKQ